MPPSGGEREKGRGKWSFSLGCFPAARPSGSQSGPGGKGSAAAPHGQAEPTCITTSQRTAQTRPPLEAHRRGPGCQGSGTRGYPASTPTSSCQIRKGRPLLPPPSAPLAPRPRPPLLTGAWVRRAEFSAESPALGVQHRERAHGNGGPSPRHQRPVGVSQPHRPGPRTPASSSSLPSLPSAMGTPKKRGGRRQARAGGSRAG